MLLEPSHTQLPDSIRRSVENWVSSPELHHLVKEFGGPEFSNSSVTEYLQNLAAFSDRWDFRRGRERVLITPEQFTSSQHEAIRSASRSLGLDTANGPSQSYYDAILVLGGTLLACALRTRYVADLIREGMRIDRIYLLGTHRNPADSERTILGTFGFERFASAADEFDMLCKVARDTFPLSAFEDDHATVRIANIGSGSFVRQYSVLESPFQLSVLCTESAMTNSRATTGDTYEHVLSMTEPGMPWRILIVTTPIYVPFQHFDAVRLIQLAHGHQVETVGFFKSGFPSSSLPLHLPENYLQEIRSAILSANRLVLTVNEARA